jgi:hypothetical protein
VLRQAILLACVFPSHALFSRCAWNAAYKVGYVCLSVCLSVRKIQLENRFTDLDEILYGRYAIGDYTKSYFSVSCTR